MTYLKSVTSRTLRAFLIYQSAQKVIIVSATIDVGPDVDVADLLELKTGTWSWTLYPVKLFGLIKACL